MGALQSDHEGQEVVVRYVGIETREKFESLCRLLRDDSFTMLTPDEAGEIIGTILAMRRVIRRADLLDECACDICQVFWRLREDLPKWIRSRRH
jgi:hypothetical protein